jgi:hypothetical protein
MKKISLVVLLICLLIFVFMSTVLAQSQKDTLNQYIADLRKNPNDNALREKIIRHVQGMQQKPAIPEEARRHFIKAVTMQKEAKDTKEFESAANSYHQALLIAPWWPEAYYNLSIALEQSGQFDGVMKALRLYIMTNPAPADARAAQDKIYEIEAKKEMAAKASGPEAMAAKKQKDDKEWLRKLNGARFTHFSSYPFGTFDMTLDIKGNEVIVGQIWKWLEPQFARNNPHVLVGVWIPSPHNFGPFTITGRQFNIPKISWCNGGINCDEMATIRDDGETIFYSFTQSEDGQRIEMVYRRQR